MPFFLTPSDDKPVMPKGSIAPVRSSRCKSNQKLPTRPAVMSCENRQIFISIQPFGLFYRECSENQMKNTKTTFTVDTRLFGQMGSCTEMVPICIVCGSI